MVKFACAAIIVFFQFSTYSTHAEQPISAPPSGYVVYSHVVGRWPEGEVSGINKLQRYYLFLLRTTGQHEPIRMTDSSDSKRTKLGAAVWYPVFSPNGKEILFTANSPPGNVDLDFLESPTYRRQGLNLFRMAIDSKSLKAVTTDGSGYDYYMWSPDGKWIAAVQIGWPPYDQVYAWDLAKGKRYLLTKRSKEESITDILWSPDGKHVLFQLWPSTGEQDPNLYAVPRGGGGKPRVLVKGRGNRSSYSFSPNGQHIAFVQDGTVYVANSDGSKAMPAIKPLKPGAKTNWPRPQWSRDNQRIAAAEVTSDSTGNHYETRLHVYDLSARQDRIVGTVKENVTGMKWSRNGQWVILKTLRTGQTEEPDAKTGWYMFRREGLLAVSVADGHAVTLKEPNEETKGLDWFEVTK